jgi:hypothetical protein
MVSLEFLKKKKKGWICRNPLPPSALNRKSQFKHTMDISDASLSSNFHSISVIKFRNSRFVISPVTSPLLRIKDLAKKQAIFGLPPRSLLNRWYSTVSANK